jgi:hypothetical protein
METDTESLYESDSELDHLFTAESETLPNICTLGSIPSLDLRFILLP